MARSSAAHRSRRARVGRVVDSGGAGSSVGKSQRSGLRANWGMSPADRMGPLAQRSPLALGLLRPQTTYRMDHRSGMAMRDASPIAAEGFVEFPSKPSLPESLSWW